MLHFKCPHCNCAYCIKLIPLLYLGEPTTHTCQASHKVPGQQEKVQCLLMPRYMTCFEHIREHETKLDLAGQNHVTQNVEKEHASLKSDDEHIKHTFCTYLLLFFDGKSQIYPNVKFFFRKFFFEKSYSR